MAHTDAQMLLLRELAESRDGWVFISGPRMKTAHVLQREGLITIGSRHHATGQPIPAWTKGWCSTAERVI